MEVAIRYAIRVLILVGIGLYCYSLFLPAGYLIPCGMDGCTILGWEAVQFGAIAVMFFPLFTVQGVFVTLTNLFVLASPVAAWRRGTGYASMIFFAWGVIAGLVPAAIHLSIHAQLFAMKKLGVGFSYWAASIWILEFCVILNLLNAIRYRLRSRP